MLEAGEVGYSRYRHQGHPRDQGGRHGNAAVGPVRRPLPGYTEVKPMVFSGLYPVEAEAYVELREALENCGLNDSSFIFEPGNGSAALGFGFRCGFLGLSTWSHPGTPRARVQPEPHYHHAQPWSTSFEPRPAMSWWSTTRPSSRRGKDRARARTVREGRGGYPGRVRGRHHGLCQERAGYIPRT
jgi:hypothetical protein